MALTLEDRFWPKVAFGDWLDCWKWAAFCRPDGYGVIQMRNRSPRSQLAHRIAYELLVGPIPEGLQLDHLCRVRSCCNPLHLEPVTGRENLLRSPLTQASINAAKTHCPARHPYTPENTRLSREGSRYCLTCKRIKNREWRARR